MTDKKEEKLEGFKTSCGKCVFAEHSAGLTQIGCQLGRLDKFIDHKRAAQGEDSNYVIEGICNTCRGEEWRKANQGVDLVSAVLREVELTVDMVLYSIDDTCDNLDWKVAQAVSACVKQKEIRPKKVIVVVKNANTSFATLYDTIQDITQQYDVPFQLVRVIEDGADVGRSIEMGIDKCSSQYTAVFDVEHKIPTNIINRLNVMVNEEMIRFLLIEPFTSYNGLIFTTAVFPMLGKNFNFPIFEKIKNVAEEQKKEHLLLTWEALWSRK